MGGKKKTTQLEKKERGEENTQGGVEQSKGGVKPFNESPADHTLVPKTPTGARKGTIEERAWKKGNAIKGKPQQRGPIVRMRLLTWGHGKEKGEGTKATKGRGGRVQGRE